LVFHLASLLREDGFQICNETYESLIHIQNMGFNFHKISLKKIMAVASKAKNTGSKL
jgi:hypothetical protein